MSDAPQFPAHQLLPFDSIGTKMTLERFRAEVKSTGIVKSDGFGFFATDREMSDLEIWPEWPSVPEWATHVVWYNK